MSWVSVLGDVSMNHQDARMVLPSIMKNINASMHLSIWMEGELHIGPVVPARAYVPGKNCSDPCPSSTYPVVSKFNSPCMYLAIFELLPLCWCLE